MRFTVVGYLIGTLLIFLAVCLLAPLSFALWWGEPTATAFAASVTACVGIGLLLRSTHMAPLEALTRREGLLAVTTAWVMCSLFGAFPFWLSGGIPNGLDAWFETMSGLTTTGASILSGIEVLPKSLLLWRSLTHWLGGLGIVVMVIAVLPSLGTEGAFLYRGEAGLTPAQFTPRLTNTAKILFVIYTSLTLAETCMLMLCGMSLFDAVTHAFGTIATGGFSPRNASVQSYHSLSIELVIIVFMFLGGCNFGLYYRLASGHWREAWQNTEWRVYVLLLCVSVCIITWDISGAGLYPSLPGALRDAAFQTVSISTTTGFVTADFDLWPPLSRTLLLVLMFSGGCLGSTSGAIKIGRLILLAKLANQRLQRLHRPRQVQVMRFEGALIEARELEYTAVFFMLYVGLAIVATLALTFLGLDGMTSISAVATTLGGVGPGLNLVGPMHNFALLAAPVKLVLIGCMLVGRLELYTLLVMCLPDFWRG